MGWTFYRREKNAETNAEHFAAKLDARYEVITHGTVDGVFYAAIGDRTTQKVTAYVALIRWGSDPLYNFGYKDMDETAGPCYYRAPKAVLNALTPTTHENALAWRANCRRHHAQRDFLREHLKPGTKIRLTHVVPFTDGTRSDTFTYARTGQKTSGFLGMGGSRCRISNWRDNVAALVEAEDREILTPLGEMQVTNKPPAENPTETLLVETASVD